jgi:hypothetical protein
MTDILEARPDFELFLAAGLVAAAAPTVERQESKG